MKELIKYQQIDIELKKVEKKVNGSEVGKKINNLKESAKKCQLRMLAINEEARKVTDEIEKITQVKLKGIELVKKYTSTNINSLTEQNCLEVVNKIKPTIKNLEELINRLNSLENKMKALLEEFDSCKKQIISSKKSFDENKTELDKLKKEIEPEVNVIKEKLTEQEKKVKPELITKYRGMKREGIFPVLVKLTDGKSCGYCRMMQSMKKLDEIKSKGYTECEQCHRIIVTDE